MDEGTFVSLVTFPCGRQTTALFKTCSLREMTDSMPIFLELDEVTN